MTNYNSINCPICDKHFNDEDDIVVCPDCGAPHHRECWHKHGECQFKEIHSEGFVWKRPQVEFSYEDEKSVADRPVACIRCGAVNEAGRLFCKNCGVALSENNQSNGQFENRFPVQPVIIDLNDPLGGAKEDESFDGVEAKNLAGFIGVRSNYFMRIFKLFKDKGSKVFFNAFAFIFTGCWFISKKMYKLGLSIASVMLLLKCAEVFLTIKYALPIAEATQNMTNQEYLAYMMTVPFENLFFIMLVYACMAASWVVMLLCGLFANNLYKKHCIKSIKSVNSEDSAAMSVLNEKKGGVNMAMAISIYVSSYLLSNLFQMFLM